LPSLSTAEKPLQERDAPRHHHHPKQKSQNASQYLHRSGPPYESTLLGGLSRVYARGKGCVKRNCVISIVCGASRVSRLAAIPFKIAPKLFKISDLLFLASLGTALEHRDTFYPHIRSEGLRNNHRSICLLVVLNNRDPCPANRK